MMINIEEDERQLIVLALALTARLRPGWRELCKEKAETLLHGGQMFDQMHAFNDNVRPVGITAWKNPTEP